MLYRRARAPGGTYFFTVNLAERDSDLLVRRVDELRAAIHQVKAAHPFSLLAMVILPDHLHAIWRLPRGDGNYAMRWSLLKAVFSRGVARGERIRPSRESKRERGLWQRRYWEHQIRDEADLARPVDYIHFNPVRHGWVRLVADRPHSTFHAYVERGMVSRDWGGEVDTVAGGYGER